MVVADIRKEVTESVSRIYPPTVSHNSCPTIAFLLVYIGADECKYARHYKRFEDKFLPCAWMCPDCE
jgi:hypothetical protein